MTANLPTLTIEAGDRPGAVHVDIDGYQLDKFLTHLELKMDGRGHATLDATFVPVLPAVRTPIEVGYLYLQNLPGGQIVAHPDHPAPSVIQISWPLLIDLEPRHRQGHLVVLDDGTTYALGPIDWSGHGSVLAFLQPPADPVDQS